MKPVHPRSPTPFRSPAAPRGPRAAVSPFVIALSLLSGCATVGQAGPTPAPAGGGGSAKGQGAAVAPRFANGGAAPAAPAASQAASAPGNGAAAAARPEPGAPRPFDEVIKGATRQPGFLALWRKDDKLWLEVPLDQLDKPFLFSANVSHSVGERGLYAGQMGPSWLASLRRVGSNQIQLVAHNTEFIATNPQMNLTVQQGFSNSLLASAPIASAQHPERRSVLVDAGFLLTDIPGYGTRIESAYRMPFALDRGNSYFERTHVTDGITSVNARVHFGMARLPAAPLVPPPVATPRPATLPDARSLFVGFVYSFTRLPEQPMAPRRADPRIGHFSDPVTDLSDDLTYNPRVHHISRWRLEKADPQAPLSEPKAPIVFWLDKNIPLKYRPAVEAGVLEWNKAFERIGFRNALVVRQQTDADEWDTLDARHASIRWFVGRDAGMAVGPHQSDPRTGEIIDADIAMSDVFGRSARRLLVEDLGAAVHRHEHATHSGGGAEAACNYAFEARHEMDFALDLLEARGELAPDSPEADALVRAVIKDTITHEVGHTLGLKHNFKASTVVSREQLRSREFTAERGLSGSVMDYNPYNLPLAGERPSTLSNTALGPYDYWAIEYAYKPLDPAQEAEELGRIAARSTDPLLAYADDADATTDGLDPLVNRFDLGDDPLAYYKRRLALSRELWDRVQARTPQPGDDPVRARRVLLNGFRQLQASATLVGKYVGGMHTQRDLPGEGSRAAYTPVDPDKQREALRFLTQGLFSADSFRFDPRFLASLSPDYNEWERGGPVSIPAAVLSVQTVALDRLMSAGTASRLLELPFYVPADRRRGIISLAEVYGSLQDAVWSELRAGREVDTLRRNLQREHLKRVQALLVRGSTTLPPDALSLVRFHATELQARLRRSANAGSLSVETRAHLSDSLATLTEALRASMVRS